MALGNFSEIFIGIQTSSLKKMHLNIDELVQEKHNSIANALE